MKNSSFNAHHVRQCCERKLGIDFRGKKELNGWYYFDKKKHARITVPQGRKFLPPKTYKTMATQLKLTVDEFDDLLECPLKHDDYKKKLKALLEK